MSKLVSYSDELVERAQVADRRGHGELRSMLTSEEIHALASAPWMGSSSDELTRIMTSMAHVCRLPTGSVLTQSLLDDGNFYGVARGAVKLVTSTASGRQLVFALAGPGDWFGAMPFVDEATPPYEAQACARSTILTIRKANLVDAIQDEPQLARAFARLYAYRATEMQEKLEEALIGTLEQRLANQLLSLALRFGASSELGVKILLKLSQQDIANLLGASRQRINEALKRLERLRLIRLEASGILLMDCNALTEICGKRLEFV